MTLVVDATGVYFNLYRFDYTMIEIAGVPLFYLLSNSAFGIIAVNFFPHKRNLNIPYILAVTATFNGIEVLFEQFSYYTLLNLSLLLDWALDLTVIAALVYLSLYLFHHRLKSLT